MENPSPNLSSDQAPPKRPLQKIKRGSASSQLHKSLRERIILLELEPGQYLSRTEIAEQYGVSQTPVRDALIKLEEEGLIVTFPQSKTEVSKIDIDHAFDTHFLRLSVELEIVRRLARAHDPSLTAKARSILAQQKAAWSENDLDAFMELDKAFHLALFEAAGVKDLYPVIGARSGHIDRLRNLNLPDPGKSSSILRLHNSILDAIEAGQVGSAETATREHLSGTLSMAEDIRARNPQFF